ncbi:MAG TPA: hypothetical protein VFQ45_03755 [Longimicrobium sp.]|nr:hypothetical protein [Longimicrobium sp.]
MATLGDRTVLLFYRDFPETDRFLPGDRHLKRLLRPLYKRITRRQKVTGFYVWYQLLVKALRRRGYDVIVDDHRLARRNPHHPVGLLGYPQILDGWRLPNPAVLGPGLLDHPKNAPGLMDDPRYRSYIVTCDWVRAMFEPYYGAACVPWHAGIDLDEWPDTRGADKDVDVLVYDKIRWHRERYEPELLAPVLEALRRRGLRVESVRYRHYDHETYRALLGRARSMLFLCEHETQGMAYQEALASNVPVLAWDNGWWLDPARPKYEPEPVPASSVPYFSPACGERFRGMEDFEETLDRFWAGLEGYTPREYVRRDLSLEGSADTYMRYYRAAAG